MFTKIFLSPLVTVRFDDEIDDRHISSWSEANASELLENFEEMFPRYLIYTWRDKFSMFTMAFWSTRNHSVTFHILYEQLSWQWVQSHDSLGITSTKETFFPRILETIGTSKKILKTYYVYWCLELEKTLESVLCVYSMEFVNAIERR